MENATNSFEDLYERLEAYGKTTIELSKLKSLEVTTVLASLVISRISVVILLSIFALVLNIGVALYLGELLGKVYYGFFIVSAFYLIAGIVLHFFLHQWIKAPVSNLIIRQALQ